MSMVGDLVRQLDGFNQLRPSSAKEDEQDMAWPGVRSTSFSFTFSFNNQPWVLKICLRCVYPYLDDLFFTF